jgi:hypothetical protein
VYVKGFALREKVQLYGMAGLFLVLLYSSPAALTLYWTLNNVFSLAKNIVFKAKNPLRAFYLIMAALAAAVLIYTVFFYDTTNRKRLVVAVVCSLILLSPLLVKIGKAFLDRYLTPALEGQKDRVFLFFLSAASLALLAGLAIPSGLISSSTQEFSYVGAAESPFGFLWIVFSKSLGFFVFWPVLLFLLFGRRAKSLITACMAVLVPIALINAFGFAGSYGTISRQMVFPNPGALKADFSFGFGNIAAMTTALVLVLGAFALRRVAAVKTLLIISFISLTGMSGYRAISIASEYAEYRAIRTAEAAAPLQDSGASLEAVYHLSRSGKNVVVMMLDRAIGPFVARIMHEDPALAEQFRGFVWYPHTLSYNGHTLAGAPPLFGGYDYLPEEINRRSGESLVSKHNEALCVMPRIFAEAGWQTTVSDASWANYSWVPDNSIFAKYPGIRAFNLEGRYSQRWLAEHGLESDPSKKIERNLLWFSFFRICPAVLRFGLYDGGKWWDSRYESDEVADFADAYAPLDYLPDLIAGDASGDTFSLIVNNASHANINLSYPECSVSRRPTDAGGDPLFSDDLTWRIFKVNLAVLRQVGEFLSALREKGIYDNTMIIIAADHGAELELDEMPKIGVKGTRLSMFTPLLMVKTFGASSAFFVDKRFRTNADVPALAAIALGGAVNPFTGHLLRESDPNETVRIVDAAIYDPSTQNKNTMKFSAADIFELRSDIFDTKTGGASR